MVKKKRASKRVTLKQKYKVERKVKDSARKVKKESARRARLGLPPLQIGRRKDKTGIPNSCPWKEELLEEISRTREKLEQDKLERRQKLNKSIVSNAQKFQKDQEELDAMMAQHGEEDLIMMTDCEGSTLSSNKNNNISNNNNMEDFENLYTDDYSRNKNNKMDNDMKNLGQQSRRAFFRELKAVLDAADVIIEVLDARDPMGSRCPALEEIILARPDKKLMLVLNKVDLVPREVVAEWLEYLRHFHPTVAFKAATQTSVYNSYSAKSVNYDITKIKNQNTLHRSAAVGQESVIQLLKNYCRSRDIKTSISVGIVGYPNVGKSSLINSLKRSKAAGVSSTPGYTKTRQEIKIDRNITLLDTPGVVFDDSEAGSVVLRNCVSVDAMKDPLLPVEEILKRCPAETLMEAYSICEFDPTDVTEFLTLIANKKGKLLKGGIADINTAAKLVLRDWNTGVVSFYARPPVYEEDEDVTKARETGASLLTTLDPALNVENINTLKTADEEVMNYLASEEMKPLNDHEKDSDMVKTRTTLTSPLPQPSLENFKNDLMDLF